MVLPTNNDIDNYDDDDNNNDYDDDDLPGRPHWVPHPEKLLHCNTGLTMFENDFNPLKLTIS